MPEGPSILILKELAAGFAGQTIGNAEGRAKIDKDRLVQQPVVAIRSWGKHFLIELPDFAVRIHLLMFGSYRINERKTDAVPTLRLQFANGEELNFYTCSVKFVEGSLSDTYDWRADVMSDEWDSKLAIKKLAAMPEVLACDALLDQTVFSGVGNIIKNEVLFRIRIHPLSTLGAMPKVKLRELVKEARLYSFQFLEWKKAFVLKQHWLAHTKSMCPRCNIPFHKGKLGITQRRSFYCERCQVRHAEPIEKQASG